MGRMNSALILPITLVIVALVFVACGGSRDILEYAGAEGVAVDFVAPFAEAADDDFATSFAGDAGTDPAMPFVGDAGTDITAPFVETPEGLATPFAETPVALPSPIALPVRERETELPAQNLIIIDTTTRFQVIEGFGASGAWWAQDVGGWDNIEDIMDLLYCRELGIGLNIFRYNIGAGFPNNAHDFWRSKPTVEVSEGVYDLSRDRNAIHVFRLAVERGATRNVAFAKSPPARMTVSGMTSGHWIPFTPNLREGYEEAFARYLVDITLLLLEEGLPIRYISPINEPQWGWGGVHASQEGAFYYPEQVVAMTRALVEEIESRGLRYSLRASVAESGTWNCWNYTLNMYRMLMDDPVIANHLTHFAVHSYWTNEMDRRRAAVFFNAIPDMLPLKQTEWCEMEWGMDLGMDAALVLANEMHADLTMLNVVSWSHWLAVSKYDYRDGLVYVDLVTREFTCSKRMWAMGNFSRFVRDGYVRVATSQGREIRDLLISAYQSPCLGEVVLVVINPSDEPRIVGVDVFGYGYTYVHITDDTRDIRTVYQRLTDIWEYEIPPRSVVTFVNRR